MKPNPTRSLLFPAFLVLLHTFCFADAGVFTGNGQNLHQISSKHVQLVSIDVTIVPGRGRFLFDSTVPGMDETSYYCTFVLKNLSEAQEEVQVGFPVDSQFAEYDRSESPLISAKESRRWVSEYSFMAWDEKKTYNVDFVRRKPKEGPGEFRELFTWTMSFAPLEARTLTVQYRIPMTMGLGSTSKEENSPHDLTDPLEQGLLNVGMEQIVGYITSTGSSWAGDVEHAKFTVINEPFEKYLNVRGLDEEEMGTHDRQQAEEEARDRESLPVRHPWWFRTISPPGWKSVKNGVQWTYTNYKPQDPITVVYFMTQFPRIPEEAGPFAEQFLKNLQNLDQSLKTRDQLERALNAPSTVREITPALKPSDELRRLKELLLATYGKEPEDERVRKHAAEQLWYAPAKDFSFEKLSPTQKAILQQIDRRIAQEEGALSSPEK